jgi:hypothetical protein
MLAQIFANTPRWVWILLIALLYLGLSQTRNRRVSLRKMTVMPLGMVGFSLFGIYSDSAFGSGSLTLLTWLAVAAMTFGWIFSAPLSAGVHYDAQSQKFSLPGSWVPMALILGIFLIKYVVGAIAASQPALLHELGFSLSFSALYGAFSGAFLARAARLWRLALQTPDLSNAQSI